ncbi:MAG TPA: ABC transporter permease [Jatrophihabitantaceae bacterium]|jgi:D-xylose transport system permease protein
MADIEVHENNSDEPNGDVIAAAVPVEGGIAEHARTYLQRVRGGDMGSLPAIIGLVALSIFFWAVHPSFGSLGNFANLMQQAASSIFIAMGLVFVLLLGEIDLAAGTAAGVCAAVMARLSVGYDWPWPASIGAAMVTGLVIGFVTGWLCAKIRIPSFVVTLALFLAFQGVVLYVVNNGKGTHGNLSITDNFINSLDNGQMANWGGWLLVAIMVLGYGAVKISASRARAKAKLLAEPYSLVAIKVVVLAAVSILAVYLLNKNRATNRQPTLVNQGGKLVQVQPPALDGVPWVVPLILAFFVITTFVLTRTRYGRHVYAVGGNAEAARRAGIPVDRIRISVFVINSFLASIGGVLLASQVRSVDQNEGGGNVLLLAVGAAVIGGTSLFGGKGRTFDAIIGGLVVAVIANGMSDLVQGNNSAAVQYIVTGAVLMLAAAIDALARRRAGSSGLG